MKKLFIGFMLICLTIIPTFAQEEHTEVINNDNKDKIVITINPEFSYETDTEILIFDSEEGLNAYLESIKIQNDLKNNGKIMTRACFPGDLYYPTCKPPVDIGTTSNVYLGMGYTNKLFVAYHIDTPAWMKASSYSVSSSRSFSGSTSYSKDGFSFSVSASVGKGVSANVLANSSKWSRLALYGEFSFKKYEVINRNSAGQVTTRAKYVTAVKNTNKYIEVKYKD